jgi:hypothetical protein
MKTLLVRPATDKKTIGIHNFMLTEPLDLEFVAGSLKRDSTCEVNLVDMTIEKKPLGYFIKRFGFRSYAGAIGSFFYFLIQNIKLIIEG